MNLDTPNGWPSNGPQSDGTWIEYIFHPNSSRIRTFVTHSNYAVYLLKRRGSNKERLLMRVYLAQGLDPKDYDAINAHIKAHQGRQWTFKVIHSFYNTDELLPPEHRYRGS
jgi:hypothetical protein